MIMKEFCFKLAIIEGRIYHELTLYRTVFKWKVSYFSFCDVHCQKADLEEVPFTSLILESVIDRFLIMIDIIYYLFFFIKNGSI